MTQAQTTATEARTEAFARGLDEGWSSANYAAAYGQPAGETFEQEAERRGHERYGVAVPERCAYVEGFAEGVERYQADQWQDGTARHEDEADDYNPVSWCMVCGWSTEDVTQTQCDCDEA